MRVASNLSDVWREAPPQRERPMGMDVPVKPGTQMHLCLASNFRLIIYVKRWSNLLFWAK
jgi:hypothetical protein